MGNNGCVSSKPVEREGDLYNKKSKKRCHLSLGAHLSKSSEGIEVNGRRGVTADSSKMFTLVRKATPQPPPMVEEGSSGQGTIED